MQYIPQRKFDITPSDTTVLPNMLGLLVIVAGDVFAEMRQDEPGTTSALGARVVGDVIIDDFRKVLAATTATVVGIV